MPEFIFRDKSTTSLDHCPRCQASCLRKCGGGLTSFCVPRCYSPVFPASRFDGIGRFADQGWWCKCCFQQVFEALPRTSQLWVREVAAVAGTWWVNTRYPQPSMASIAGRALSSASLKTKTGRLWVSPSDSTDQRMKVCSGRDWIVAGIDPNYAGNKNDSKIYALTVDLASLLPAEGRT